MLQGKGDCLKMGERKKGPNNPTFDKRMSRKQTHTINISGRKRKACAYGFKANSNSKGLGQDL